MMIRKASSALYQRTYIVHALPTLAIRHVWSSRRRVQTSEKGYPPPSSWHILSIYCTEAHVNGKPSRLTRRLWRQPWSFFFTHETVQLAYNLSTNYLPITKKSSCYKCRIGSWLWKSWKLCNGFNGRCLTAFLTEGTAISTKNLSSACFCNATSPVVVLADFIQQIYDKGLKSSLIIVLQV